MPRIAFNTQAAALLLWGLALVWCGLWLSRWGLDGSLPRVLFRTVAPLLLPARPPAGRAQQMALVLVGASVLLTLAFWGLLLVGIPEVFFWATALFYLPITFVMLSTAAIVVWWVSE